MIMQGMRLLMIALAATVSVLSVTSGVAAPVTGFRAGAATSNITPDLGVVLDGTIMQIGPGKHVHDELHARCLVLEDGKQRIAFAICDVTMISREVVDKARSMASEATGIPASHMVVSATHTHSTPRAIPLGLGDANDRYETFLASRIADGIRRANNLLAPARIGWTSVQKPEHVHNRRWFVKPQAIPTNPFGGKSDQVVMGPPQGALIKPAGPVDPEVFILSVQHADGRPLALLANYGLHYVGGIPSGTISADYYGAFSQMIEENLGKPEQDPPFVAMMSNGTSGDVNNVDPTQPRSGMPVYGKMNAVARDMAVTILAALPKIQYTTNAPIAAAESELDLAVRKPDAERLAWAKDLDAKAAGKQRRTRPEVYARETRMLSEYPDVMPVRLQALRIGDLSIATIPNEVFAETGLNIKKMSPAKATFTIELANGYHGYLPTAHQHTLGGYETWAARSSYLELNAAAKIEAEVLKLIGQINP